IHRHRKGASDTIISEAESGADRRFALAAEDPLHEFVFELRRVGDGEARSEIILVPIVEPTFAIGRAGKVIGDVGGLVRRDALPHPYPALVEPIAKADVGRDLIAVGLIWRRVK